MRRILCAAILIALVGVFSAQADWTTKTNVALCDLTTLTTTTTSVTNDVAVDELNTQMKGYETVVCSAFVNSSVGLGAADYVVVEPAEGTFIEHISIVEAACSEAQTFTFRCWNSAADSTGRGGALTQTLKSGGGGQYNYPISCVKVSLVGVAATDDFYVYAYCRSYD